MKQELLLGEAAPLPVIIINSEWHVCWSKRSQCTHRIPKLIQRQSKAHTMDVGHTDQNAAASHSWNVKVKVVSEHTGGRSVCVCVCVCELNDQDEGRLILSPNNHYKNTVFPKKKHCFCRIPWKCVNDRLISLDGVFRVFQGWHLFWFWK